VATKIKLVYAGDEPGHEHIVEIWTDGPHAAAGHVLDALMGVYSKPAPTDTIAQRVPMRLEIVPNAPDVPMPYQEQQADG
jgi:hypothetical protein